MISYPHRTRIQKAFSRSADGYEELSDLQQQVGNELIRLADDLGSHRRILDVGMGTGLLTRRLKQRWPSAQVVGLDFAFGMVAQARRRPEDVRLIQADASLLPFKKETFDLVFSNLAYQWVDGLPQVFTSTAANLKPGGCFCLSLFTRNSLQELFVSLRQAVQERRGLREIYIRHLPTAQEVLNAVGQAGLRLSVERRQHMRLAFWDLMALLRWLKGIGANAAPRDFYVGKEMLKRADVHCRKEFGDEHRIYISFEILLIQAFRPRKG